MILQTSSKVLFKVCGVRYKQKRRQGKDSEGVSIVDCIQNARFRISGLELFDLS